MLADPGTQGIRWEKVSILLEAVSQILEKKSCVITYRIISFADMHILNHIQLTLSTSVLMI